MRILVVDDHSEVLDVVKRSLARDDHVVATASTAAQARAHLDGHGVDLIVLDLALPDGSGRDLCRELRGSGCAVPILVLTAKSAVSSRVECLNAGADDYLSKPFAVAELRARVRALGRRPAALRTMLCEDGDLRIDFGARRAFVRDRPAPLTAREWAIIELLAARNGRVVARGEVLETVWGQASEAASASLDVLVGRIRRKLRPDVIRTVRNEGYAFVK